MSLPPRISLTSPDMYPLTRLNPFLNIILLLLFCGLGGVSPLKAQVNLHPGTEGILLALEQVPYRSSILYIAAHPDDENNRLLSYLVKGKHVRVGYLALTRGEGGQNLIGREQGETLGLIRTEELLAARGVDGAEQFFSRAIDFGFSKNPEETLLFWNRDSILSDMVWVIRNFQPDIIVDRFPTTGEGGHGNHTASAILTLDAVKLAADPNAFPEQLKKVPIWKVNKVYWNTFNFGGLNTTAKDQIHFQVNGYNPVLGQTYSEIAAKSRSNHKSQGFGSGSAKGDQYEYFKLLTGKNTSNNLWDGMDSTWKDQKGCGPAYEAIQAAIRNFNPSHPEQILPDLAKTYREIQKWDPSSLKTRKIKEITELMIACAGVQVDVYSTNDLVSFGEKLTVMVDLVRRTSDSVRIERAELLGQTKTDLHKFLIQTNQPDLLIFVLKVDSTLSTQPYFLKSANSSFRYKVPNPNLIGLAKTPNPLQVHLFFNYEGLPLELAYPVRYKKVDPVKGEYYEPIAIVPPVSAETEGKVYLFNSEKDQKIKVKVTALRDSLKGITHIALPSGWISKPSTIEINIPKKLGIQEIEFLVQPPKGKILDSRIDSAIIETQYQGKSYSDTYHKIEYEHIPTITYTQTSRFKLIRLPLVTPNRLIGYIAGAGDYIPDVLQQIGYPVHFLTDAELTEEGFKKYQTIIIGVRAYNVRNALPFAHAALMNYVKNGGTLLVQYNTTANLLSSQMGPYPFGIDRERVTDETASVQITLPLSSLLNYPNKITPADFKDWVQERGLYYPKLPMNSPYQTLLSMHDPGEENLSTSIIYTGFGKGVFIYTPLAFFRQLPAGNPGAIRLFINLINARNEKPI